MYTPSDSQWIRDNRERDAFRTSEARWSIEGAVVPAPERPGLPLRILKRLFQRAEPSDPACTLLETTCQIEA